MKANSSRLALSKRSVAEMGGASGRAAVAAAVLPEGDAADEAAGVGDGRPAARGGGTGHRHAVPNYVDAGHAGAEERGALMMADRHDLSERGQPLPGERSLEQQRRPGDGNGQTASGEAAHAGIGIAKRSVAAQLRFVRTNCLEVPRVVDGGDPPEHRKDGRRQLAKKRQHVHGVGTQLVERAQQPYPR